MRKSTLSKVRYLVIGVFIGVFLSFAYSYITTSKESALVNDSNYVFGIDISHYQGKIKWAKVKESHHPIKYIFIRSTMGKDGIDSKFEENWKMADEYGYIRGAYHYYRPNENSTDQFKNYANKVKLTSGDFIPILDVEKSSKYGKKNLQKGVLNWLKLAEEKYGVKPMIYSGRTFYNQNLKAVLKDYPLWVASYSSKHKVEHLKWAFHQFTEEVKVKGIKGYVDGNDFNGSVLDLEKMCISPSL